MRDAYTGKEKTEYLLDVNRLLRDAIRRWKLKKRKILKPLFSKLLQTLNDLDMITDIERGCQVQRV